MDCVQLFLESSNIKFNAERSTLYDYSLSGLSIDNELNEYRKAFAAYDKAIYKNNYDAMRKNEEWVKAKEGKLILKAAHYDIATGKVTIME